VPLAPEFSALPDEQAATESSPVTREKKPLLPALTGLRCFAALNIVFFHFSNPQWFGVFAPIVDNGYTSVSFFILLSGFILAYNYGERGLRGELKTGAFYIARLSRLYPVYLFALLVSTGMLIEEYHAHTHTEFVLGTILTPVLLQGWSPTLSTFWNTPAWTMSTEAVFYLLFPLAIRWRRPKRMSWLLALLGALWLAGMVLPALYVWFSPDGNLHPGRYETGWWMRALKFTPPPHLPSFLFGVVLAELDGRIQRDAWVRLVLGGLGVGALYAILFYGGRIPFALMHDGLLMPLFGAAILGLAGRNVVSKFFGFLPFVLIGESSYCLYLLHFNLWNLIHESGLLEKTGLIQLDPWFSYFLLILGAVLTMVLIERPGQRWIRSLTKR
jgi:peptidoglycan/LPS O-acetylase OafA/YrhL